MLTITPTEYRKLTRRQEKIEEELRVLKEIVRQETQERAISPSVLRRWERISRDLDAGKGKTFISMKDMDRWFKSL